MRIVVCMLVILCAAAIERIGSADFDSAPPPKSVTAAIERVREALRAMESSGLLYDAKAERTIFVRGTNPKEPASLQLMDPPMKIASNVRVGVLGDRIVVDSEVYETNSKSHKGARRRTYADSGKQVEANPKDISRAKAVYSADNSATGVNHPVLELAPRVFFRSLIESPFVLDLKSFKPDLKETVHELPDAVRFTWAYSLPDGSRSERLEFTVERQSAWLPTIIRYYDRDKLRREKLIAWRRFDGSASNSAWVPVEVRDRTFADPNQFSDKSHAAKQPIVNSEDTLRIDPKAVVLGQVEAGQFVQEPVLADATVVVDRGRVMRVGQPKPDPTPFNPFWIGLSASGVLLGLGLWIRARRLRQT